MAHELSIQMGEDLTIDDRDGVSIHRSSSGDSIGRIFKSKGLRETKPAPIDVETPEQWNTQPWTQRSTTPIEDISQICAMSPVSGTSKLKKAIKAMSMRFNTPNRTEKTCQTSTENTGEGANTPTKIGQPSQDQARHPVRAKTEPPGTSRTHPIRSAMRGARPRRPTDASRLVSFAQQDSVAKSSPWPVRSAIRGSRPQRAGDSSRRVRFDMDASTWIPQDADA